MATVHQQAGVSRENTTSPDGEVVKLERATLPKGDQLRTPTLEQSPVQGVSPQAPQREFKPLDPYAAGKTEAGEWLHTLGCGPVSRWVVPGAASAVGGTLAAAGASWTVLGAAPAAIAVGSVSAAGATTIQDKLCDGETNLGNTLGSGILGAFGGQIAVSFGAAIAKTASVAVGTLGFATFAGWGANRIEEKMGPQKLDGETTIDKGVRFVARYYRNAERLVTMAVTGGISEIDRENKPLARSGEVELERAVLGALESRANAYNEQNGAQQQALVEKLASASALRAFVENSSLVTKDRNNGFRVAEGATLTEVSSWGERKIAEGNTGPYTNPETGQLTSAPTRALREVNLQGPLTPERLAPVYRALRGMIDAKGNGVRTQNDIPAPGAIDYADVTDQAGNVVRRQIFVISTDPHFGENDRAYQATLQIKRRSDEANGIPPAR
ncbi:MAG: hypothetical protein IT290_12515 [Deltaproteobacteria bacterium]|nr:hypothetical protein [Deltaproteobacteria bacterium]